MQSKNEFIEEFIEKVSKIEGISKNKAHALAEALYSAGFTSSEKIKTARIGKLSQVEGIKRKLAKEIIKVYGGKIEEKKIEKPKEEVKKVEMKEEKKEEKEEKKKVEIVEKEEVKKIKPELSEEVKNALKLRKQLKNKTPTFLRQEWFRYKELGKKWRYARGSHSKLRRQKKYRITKPKIGFGGPRLARYLHSSGFQEVLVHSVKELKGINPKIQAIRIGKTVGSRKREEIIKIADEKGIRILNRGG